MGGAKADEDIHRGLQNFPGQNNCFLNSALQTLWHLPKFRRALAEFCIPDDHDDKFVIELLPSLQTLFANFEYGEDSVLPADEVRAVMSNLYSEEGKFAIGKIDDAVECLEAILLTLHCECVGVKEKDGGDELVCSPPCPACEVFKVAYFDMAKCSECPATGDPVSQSDFIYRVWVDECLQGAPNETFEGSLKRVWETDVNGSGKVKGCPAVEEACRNGQSIPERWCVQLPTVLTANLVWSSGRPPVEDIDRILNMLRCSVDLGKVFTIPATDMENGRPTYRFCGMICYYGLHYVSLFARRCQNKKSQNYGQWLLFDDARIHALSNWNAVKAFCVKAHYQPTVVWFERVPEGEAPWWDDDEPEVPLIHQAAEEEVSITSSAMSLLNGIVDGVSDGVSSLAKPLVGDHTAVPRKQHTRPSHTANPISSSSSSSPSWSFEEGQGMKSKKEWSFDQGKGDRGDIYPRKSQATSHFGNDQAKPDRGEVYPRKSQLISQPDYITVSHEDRYRQPLAPKSKPTQAEAKLMEVDEPQDKSQVPESRTRLGTSGTSGNGGESSEGGGHARPKRFQAESKLMEADEPQDKSHVPDSRTHRGINGGASGEKNPAADPSCSLPKPPESTPPPAYSSLKGPLAKSQIDEPEDTEDVYVMPKMNNTHELVPTTSPRYNVSINYAPDSNQPGKHYLGTPRSTFQGSGLICDVVEDDGILRVKAFSKLGNGEYLLPLEIRSRINIGDRLVSVSGKLLSGQSVNMARSNIEHAAKYSFMMRKGTPAIFELERFRG